MLDVYPPILLRSLVRLDASTAIPRSNRGHLCRSDRRSERSGDSDSEVYRDCLLNTGEPRLTRRTKVRRFR